MAKPKTMVLKKITMNLGRRKMNLGRRKMELRRRTMELEPKKKLNGNGVWSRNYKIRRPMSEITFLK